MATDQNSNQILKSYKELLATVTSEGNQALTIKHSILLRLIGLNSYTDRARIITEVSSLINSLTANKNYIEIQDDTMSAVIGNLTECILVDKNQQARPAFILKDISLLLSIKPTDVDFTPEMSVFEKLFKLNPTIIRSCLYSISRLKTTGSVPEINTLDELNELLGDGDFALYTDVGCFTCYEDRDGEIHINCIHKNKAEDFIDTLDLNYFMEILASFVKDESK